MKHNQSNLNPGPLKMSPGHLKWEGSGPGWPLASENYVTLCGSISLWTEWLTDRHDWKYYLPWRAVTSVFRGSTCIQFYRHSWKIHSCQGRLQFETLYCVPWSIYSVTGSRTTHTPTQCRCFSFFLRFQTLRKVGQHDLHCELEHCEIGEPGLILSNLEPTFDLFCCTVSSSLN